jgi:hypothetical protein
VQSWKSVGIKECKSMGEAQGSKSAGLQECRNEEVQESGGAQESMSGACTRVRESRQMHRCRTILLQDCLNEAAN